MKKPGNSGLFCWINIIMANKFTRFLTQAGNGLTNPKGMMGNWQHASRIFIDDTFRLSPRTKFLYYVYFDIDKSAFNAPQFSNRHMQELGVLVKTADLPKFNFDIDVKNQYNRKKLIYKQINYEPINITMHDDSNGIVNALWAVYYGTYVQDRHNPTMAYNALHYRPSSSGVMDNFRYGMDKSKSSDFFRSVSIYTMSRKRFLGYTLINPRITSWQHGAMDYSATDVNESSMTLQYEAVQYSAGTVSQGSPKGFANLHYDYTPSPISVAGGGVASLTGEGGVLDGLESIFGAVSDGTTFNSFGGFLGTAVAAVNTYKNFKSLSKEGLKQEAINILTQPGSLNRIGGVIGSVFPKNQESNATTTATQKNVVPPVDFT